MELPTFETYGKYKSENYGIHTLRICLPNGVNVWFSYKTPVAFYVPGKGLKVCQNLWGNTTGKHLNWIDGGSRADKARRLDRKTFEKELVGVFKHEG